MLPTFVSAHVINENNIYGDIAYSEAKEEIVFLSGMNIIFYEHGDALFRPSELLQRSDLAAWAANFFQLGTGEESIDDLKQLALESKLVSTLSGNATYGDVNQAFFQGKIKIEHEQQELKREEFASFMSEYLLTELEDGQTLYDVAGFTSGPAGLIEEVHVIEEVSDSGQSTTHYQLVIEQQEYTLAAHPRVSGASVDPLVWKGQKLEQSWLREEESEEKLQQLVFSKSDSQLDDQTDSVSAHTHQHHAGNNQLQETNKVEKEEKNPTWIYLSISAVLLGIILFIVWKKKSSEQ